MAEKCDDDNHKAPMLRIAVLEERVKGRDEALQLQAKEYERRLAELNHSHTLAQQRYAEFLPRTDFEAFQKELSKWQTILDLERAAATGTKTAYLAIASAVVSGLSLAAVLYGVFLS